MEHGGLGAEFVAADLILPHPVSEQELQQCLSPAGDHQHVYVFTAMFFGHKSAGGPSDSSSSLLTMAAWGIQLALHKGARGACLVWIGVQCNLRWREGSLRVEVPEKQRLEIVDKLSRWQNAGMGPFSELRSIAGKLTMGCRDDLHGTVSPRSRNQVRGRSFQAKS